MTTDETRPWGSAASSVTIQGEEKGTVLEKAILDTPQTDDNNQDERDPLEVDFDGPDDPNNPTNWSKSYRWTVISLISFMTLVVNLATIMCAPAAPIILHDFKENNQLYITLIVSIWELGEAFAPLFVAPLSEMFGRRIVYNVANCLFVVFSIAAAVSQDIGQLLAFRFLTGMSVASVVLNPCLVGDLFAVKERGTAISIMGLAPLLGPVTGPIIGGYMSSSSLGWRSTFWLVAITAGVLEVVFLFTYRESYKPYILKRKAQELRKQTGQDYHTKYSTLSGSEFVVKSLIRPAHMLFLSPIIFLLALYGAAVFGYLYFLITSVTGVFQSTYGFSTGAASLTFLGFTLGMVTGVFICKFTLDRRVRHLTALNALTPESARIPHMLVGAACIPPGLLMYGWTVQHHVHWIVPLIGLGIFGVGVALTIIPSIGYLVDAFGVHAASAIAANLCLRCVVGAVLPLSGPSLYSRLGYGWGNTVLALIAVAFTPVIVVVWRYGDAARRKSKLKVMT